jgi:hypothetical protein
MQRFSHSISKKNNIPCGDHVLLSDCELVAAAKPLTFFFLLMLLGRLSLKITSSFPFSAILPHNNVQFT